MAIRKRRKKHYPALILCAAGVMFCGIMLYREWYPRYQAETEYQGVRDFAFAGISGPDGNDESVKESAGYQTEVRRPPDFAALLAWNPDIRGWIWLPGTDIDYPVVQGRDNDYYLNHTAGGTSSIIGAVFMESKNQGDFSDEVTVLYGHHISGGRMFSPLSGYKEQSFFEQHPEVILYTPEQVYRVELFAGQILDGGSDSFVLEFSTESGRAEWLDRTLSGSPFKSPVRPEADERILVLCTCTYEYNNARFAVYGVIREWDER